MTVAGQASCSLGGVRRVTPASVQGSGFKVRGSRFKVTGPLSFSLLKQLVPGMSFVNRASISFGVVVAAMLLLTALKPLATPVEFATKATIELRSSRSAKVLGAVVVLLTLVLYVIFF